MAEEMAPTTVETDAIASVPTMQPPRGSGGTPDQEV
jgi:hypothetical protein